MFRLFIYLKRLQQTENRQLIDAKKNKIEKLHNDGRILVLKSPITWKREKKLTLVITIKSVNDPFVPIYNHFERSILHNFIRIFHYL